MNIGKLQEVHLRELWSHEQSDFSEWLARAENCELLNDALGLTLTDVQTETFVGSYRADLVAKDETSNMTVVIENQLESTNHDHLGKIITYASGLDADVVVWIVKTAREEHRSAIEWLNQKTLDGISFFLIEIHAYCIGDSLPAPKFEVIEKPNDFNKLRNKPAVDKEVGRTGAERLEFWTLLNETLSDRGNPFNQRKATTDHWYDVAIGTSEANLSINLINAQGFIGIDLYIRDNKELFDHFHGSAPQIEADLGFTMDWDRLEGKKACRVRYVIEGLNFDDHSNYPELINQVIDVAVAMRRVFKKYL